MFRRGILAIVMKQKMVYFKRRGGFWFCSINTKCVLVHKEVNTLQKKIKK